MSDAMIRVRRPAMGCELELVLCGPSKDYLVAVAEEAFEEVGRLEEQLSVFIPTSEVSDINNRAAFEPVRVQPRLLRLLKKAEELWRETEGAFDITAGSLVSLWDFSTSRIPSESEIRAALDATGMSKLILDEDEFTVRFSIPGMRINLGAIGKGYAASEVVEFLREHEIGSALVAAGNSTIYALGSPPDDDAWTIGVRSPLDQSQRITSVRLRDQAMSTSGSHERFVEIEGVRYSHIIDPQTGWPATGLLLACAVVDDPVSSDALSTGFFIQGLDWTRTYCESRETGALMVIRESSGESPAIHKIRVT